MARAISIRETFRIVAQKTVEATQRSLVATAKREHARIMATDPQPKRFARFVDGRAGAPEEAVRHNGVILYRYPRLDGVAQFAMETLFDLSPVLSGEYRMGHRLFLNGAEVPNLSAYASGDDVAITNYLPYSRKIELGTMTMRLPGSSMVYQQARAKVLARFGNIASIDFTYRGLIGRSSGAGTLVNPAKAKGKAHNKSELRFPVLIIRER